MKYDEVSIEVDAPFSDDMEQFLLQQDLSFEIADQTTLQPPPAGMVRFRLYLDEHERKTLLADMLQDGSFEHARIEVRSRDESEWRDQWKQFFHTRVVGRFAIVPSWEEEQYRSSPNQFAIRLDPGRAFGTGGHASTRLCLMLMDERTTNVKSILDVGCGCGTLAIAGLLAHPSAQAMAIDIDSEAVEVTKENAERNLVDKKMDVSTRELRTMTDTYELVLANLTGPTLIELAGDLVGRLRMGGRLIIAGILQTEAMDVLGVFSRLGLVMEESLTEDEWAAFRLVK